MAIKLNHIASSIGATFENAYHRISGVSIQYISGQPVKHVVNIHVDVFADTVASATGARPVDTLLFSIKMSDIDAQAGANLIAKCYEWLKTQPELAAGTIV